MFNTLPRSILPMHIYFFRRRIFKRRFKNGAMGARYQTRHVNKDDIHERKRRLTVSIVPILQFYKTKIVIRCQKIARG